MNSVDLNYTVAELYADVVCATSVTWLSVCMRLSLIFEGLNERIGGEITVEKNEVEQAVRFTFEEKVTVNQGERSHFILYVY